MDFERALELGKGFREGRGPLSRSFAFQLFRGTDWFFHRLPAPAVPEPAAAEPAAAEPAAAEPDAPGPPGILAAFVAETPRDAGEPDGGLLSRMIAAMPFGEGEEARLFVDGKRPEPESWRLLEAELLELRPRAVVTLGALATQMVLSRIPGPDKSRKRLGMVHGREFRLTLGGIPVPCFPVFHPDFLHINPNMKRAAWMDLQKVAKHLGREIGGSSSA